MLDQHNDQHVSFLIIYFFFPSPLLGFSVLFFCCIFSFWKRRWIVRLPLDSSVFRLVASATVEHPTQEAVRQHCSCKLSFIIMSGPNWRGCCLDNSQLTMWLLPLWRRVAYIFFFIFFLLCVWTLNVTIFSSPVLLFYDPQQSHPLPTTTTTKSHFSWW